MTDMTKQTEAISTERALKLALEALEIERNVPRLGPVPTKTSKAITALREALTSVPDWASVAKEQPVPATELREQEPVAWRELCRRLYVELFHCDQQMMATLDEDGEPVWTQGKTVRDVLADAKAALDTSPPARKPWVGLTVDEILYCVELENPKAIVEEVEAKLREKNA